MAIVNDSEGDWSLTQDESNHLTRNIDSRRIRDNSLEYCRREGQWTNTNVATSNMDIAIITDNGILSLG